MNSKIAISQRGLEAWRYQRGVTLLEVMIAAFILSVSLLGVASMQLKALQSASLSYNRTLATLAAQDAVERLWEERITSGECPPADGVESDWEAAWGGVLFGFSASSISSSSCRYTITVRWAEERFDSYVEGDVANFVYMVELPPES